VWESLRDVASSSSVLEISKEIIHTLTPNVHLLFLMWIWHCWMKGSRPHGPCLDRLRLFDHDTLAKQSEGLPPPTVPRWRPKVVTHTMPRRLYAHFEASWTQVSMLRAGQAALRMNETPVGLCGLPRRTSEMERCLAYLDAPVERARRLQDPV
jgi:hypothetical protein